MTATFPPAAGELAIASLVAFCDGATLRDGVIYAAMPREKISEILKLGWLPLGPCGVRDGLTVDLFAWLCACKFEVPA